MKLDVLNLISLFGVLAVASAQHVDPSLPPQKASVVLPLLKKCLSGPGTAEQKLHALRRIIGVGMGEGGGPTGHRWEDETFELDDKTTIQLNDDGYKISIDFREPGKKPLTLRSED